MKATVQGWAAQQLYHHCIDVEFFIYQAATDKESWMKKSNQTEWLDKAKHVNTVYLEFCKDFNIIFQSILLEELAAHGLDRCTILWVHTGPESRDESSHNQRLASH